MGHLPTPAANRDRRKSKQLFMAEFTCTTECPEYFEIQTVRCHADPLRCLQRWCDQNFEAYIAQLKDLVDLALKWASAEEK
jgi:hypothetical protein